MKVLNFKNYGSIPHLSNSKLGERDYYINEGQEKILTKKRRDKHDVILVFEKYDGSNVGVTKKDGNIFALTRSGYEASTSPYRQHHEFAKWVGRRFNLFDSILDEGERLVGEWLYQAHGTIYTIKEEPIIFYDYFNKDNQRYTYDVLESTNLPLARLLHKGDSISVSKLLPILNKKTAHIESQENPEGMVYRVERNNKVDFLAKWVRSDFIPGKYFTNVKEEDYIYNIEI